MKIFYRPEQVASNTAAYSPSAYKPRLVMEDWLALGLIDAQDIQSFEPVSRADFKRVHNPQMVDDVLDLRRRNGFRNCDAEVAASLPYTSGSLLAASRWALPDGRLRTAPMPVRPPAAFTMPGMKSPRGIAPSTA